MPAADLPTRTRKRAGILARLATGETSVTELAAPFEMSMPAVSKHLKVLERAGLIARGREAQWRPCKLEAGPLKEVADWVHHYQRFWERSLKSLDSYLVELQEKGKAAKKMDASNGRTKTAERAVMHHARVRCTARTDVPGMDAVQCI